MLSDVSAGIDRLKAGMELFIGFSPNFTKKYSLQFFERQNKLAYIELNEIKSKEAAELFKEQAVFAEDSSDEIKEQTESYYVEELIGCKVHDIKTKEFIGTIKEVLLLPANDVWMVETSKGELPVPFIDDVVKTCDTKNKYIEINVIDGLLGLIKEKPEVK